MQAFPVIRSSDLSSLPGPALFIPRTQLTLTKKLFFCSAKFGVAPANLLVAEKEEAKAVLTLFLKKRGLSKGESLQLLRSRAVVRTGMPNGEGLRTPRALRFRWIAIQVERFSKYHHSVVLWICLPRWRL
ncbi:hypothetical protein Vadar_020905 [Vaccinium darrowii]|uniref:Uncharacterized protein n=1 Tax=Vaccinium darrowii TaxID=229202 RepID=A0ACB7YFB7_9ERIC|nr:hypothetical protein Vadar_020905 [Vaccinium darrowii]